MRRLYVADTTNPVPSITEPAVDRYRRWSPVWYPWIKRLLDTLRSTATDLATVTTTVDQVAGQWGVSVNVNNRVTAAIALDGSATESAFGILADKFIVVHPSADGTTIQAFTVGNVGGVSTVGINGNLMVDGSIAASRLSVSTLSSITANIGTVTAGVIQSSDGLFQIDLNNKTITITT